VINHQAEGPSPKPSAQSRIDASRSASDDDCVPRLTGTLDDVFDIGLQHEALANEIRR
jgi:hypothetical protein